MPDIDYTTMRKGAIVTRDIHGKAHRVIAVCPKCGRKGAARREEHVPGKPIMSYYHHSTDWGWAVYIDDGCSVSVQGDEE